MGFPIGIVKAINISGHKYGLVYPGIGWALWRDEAPSRSSGFFLNAHQGHAFHELDQTPDDGDEAKDEDTVVNTQEVVELHHFLQDLHEARHQERNAREEGKAWVFGQGRDVTGNKAAGGR